MKTLLSTETSCLLSTYSLKDYNISVFPLNVLIDEVEYLDGVTINQEQLCVAMRSNKSIKTSTPPMGVVVEYFEKLFEQGYERIIHFTISSKFSSMYSLFQTVSTNFFDNKIIVIDSLGVSSIMLSEVLYTYEELQKGTSIEDILPHLEEIRNKSKVYFIPENLNALKNGGRISPAVAMIGNTFGIKPVISLTGGELAKSGTARNIRVAFFGKIKEFIEEYDHTQYNYSLIDFDGNQGNVSSIERHLKESVGEENVIKGIIPVNLCAHCGPGTIGLVITPKIGTINLK